MSIVAAVRGKDKLVIGADTQTTYGARQASPPNLVTASKIRKFGDAYMGWVGLALLGPVLDEYSTRIPAPEFENRLEVFAFFSQFRRVLKQDYSLVKDVPDKSTDVFATIDNIFLVISPSGIFEVWEDLGVDEYAQYWAIGSGSDYALGAMGTVWASGERNARKICEAGVDIAIEFDEACGGETEFFELKVGKEK